MRSWLVGLAVLAAACREVAPCVPGEQQGCYIVNGLGDEGCAPTAQHADGASCWNIFDCAPGEQCFGKTCRPFCGGPGNIACATGTCTAVSGSVPTTVGGVCVP